MPSSRLNMRIPVTSCVKPDSCDSLSCRDRPMNTLTSEFGKVLSRAARASRQKLHVVTLMDTCCFSDHVEIHRIAQLALDNHVCDNLAVQVYSMRRGHERIRKASCLSFSARTFNGHKPFGLAVEDVLEHGSQLGGLFCIFLAQMLGLNRHATIKKQLHPQGF